MTRLASIGVVAAGLVLTMGAALAQDHGAPPAGQSQMAQHSSMTSMMGQMSKLKATVARARASNDPIKMRAALTEVQSYLSRMGMHKKMMGCTNMSPSQGGMMSHGEMNSARPPPKGQ